MANSNNGPRVPALVRAVELLEIAATERVPLSLGELARRMGLAKSSVLNLCNSLVDERLLLRGHDGSYRSGPRLVEIAAPMQEDIRPLQNIGMTVQNESNVFFAAEIRSASEEAKRIGATLRSACANGDPRVQSAQIRSFVDNGADLVIVDPVDSRGIEAAADYARSRGVWIVAVNGSATSVDGAVTTDNAQAGFLAGQHLSNVLAPGEQVAIIDGARITAIADRVDGFRRALVETERLVIADHVTGDNSFEAGERLGRQLLAENPSIAGIFAINDPTALGVSHAYDSARRTVRIIGVDGSREAIADIASGGNIIATAVQDPEMLGRRSVRLGLQLASGARPVNRTVLLPTQLITAQKIEGYKPW